MKRLDCRAMRVLLSLVPVILLAVACTPPATPDPTSTPSPTSTPDPEVTLAYEGNAQFELISSEGTRVLMDVYAASRLTEPATERDVLLVSHRHADHFLHPFVDSFSGQQLVVQAGEIDLADVRITGIPSTHDANRPPLPVGGSNYIFVVDAGGLRIVHFGDIGQEELTQEQLDALGEVDVAIILFAGCGADPATNRIPRLLEQVGPKLIIPTHADAVSLQRAAELWESYCGDDADQARVTIRRSDLSGEAKFLMLGENAAICRQALDVPDW
jgi:L-ascorbate metabolism protein UlaG (beta-lactamase superfamily)